MSTLWEMATTIREEKVVRFAPRARNPQAAVVDLDEPARVDYWCKLLGTTPWRLCCAIDHVGTDPTAIRRFLVKQPRQSSIRAVRTA